jgi:diphthine-ammonia ligase
MYQTVGQDAIELVACALEVPLYRQVIAGTAVEQGSEYGTRSDKAGVTGDETEDLFTLLSLVKVLLACAVLPCGTASHLCLGSTPRR